MDTTFGFSSAPFSGQLDVLSFRGKETVSRLFRFDVDLTAADLDLHGLERELLAKPASLSMHLPGDELRAVHGIVAAIEARGAFERGRQSFRARLVPRLWLLGKRKTSRVFQDLTVPKIVSAVLDQARVRRRWALVNKYPERTYCVQYQETDLAFVTRLLAEEGIFYFFEHGEDGETVVFCDSAHVYPSIAGDPRLAYRFEEGSDGLVPEEHHVGRFALRRALEPGATLLHDYDFRRPNRLLRAERVGEGALADEVGCRVYEHHGEDERPAVDARTARVALEQARRHVFIAGGRSACRRLMPGARFELFDHDIERLDGEYVVAEVEHRGRAPKVAKLGEHVYSNTFTCVPAEVPLRPRRRPHVLQQVVESAVVVGPPGEEIHTDEHGRVKVRFPWDLDCGRNDHRSCWVRVAQSWAGRGWGTQHVPRVGSEVLVAFIGGDTDRPVIVGSLYNGLNVPPFALPANKTQSGVRTQSTPGGEGYNELVFDDAAGRELVSLRAQRDLRQVVVRERQTTIGGDDALDVGASRTVAVGGDEMVRVGGSEVIEIGEDLVLHVRGRAHVVVDGESFGVPEGAPAASRTVFSEHEGGGSGHGGGGGGENPFDRDPGPAPEERPRPPEDKDPFHKAGNGDWATAPPPAREKEQPRDEGPSRAEPQVPAGGATPKWDGSTLRFARTAEVFAPGGLRLIGPGCEIEMKGGVMTLKASSINIQGSDVDIKGQPIRLN